MKRSILVTAIVIFLLVPSIFANGNENQSNTTTNYTLIESNYLAGLTSDNCGLRNSCAFFLGEMKSEKAVLPLMKLLRCATKDCTRIYAALSLIKIGDPRGVYLVKRTAIFDDNDRVKRICTQFYNAFQNSEISDDYFPEEYLIATTK